MSRDRRGVVLIFAVGCLALVAAVMAGLSEQGLTTRKMIAHRDGQLRAQTAAVSGLHYAMARLRQRGLLYQKAAPAGGDPAPAADDRWIVDLSSQSVPLQDAAGPHEHLRSSFTVRVAPQSGSSAPSPSSGFVRANLARPAQLGSAVRFVLTVTGLCAADDGRVLARSSLTQVFIGANCVPLETRDSS